MAVQYPAAKRLATQIVKAIKSDRVMKGKPVKFDPITLIMLLIPLILEIIKQIQACQAKPAAGVDVFQNPGLLVRRRLWKAIRRRDWQDDLLTDDEIYAACISCGQDVDKATVTGLYADIE